MNECTFDTLVRNMEARLYRTARAMLRSDADCADAIQNAVFLAWQKRNTLRDEACFEAWMTRILVNACRDVQRGYQKAKKEAPLEEAFFIADVPPKNMELQEALKALPQNYRLPVLLHHIEGQTVKQVALALRLPTATVKWRIHEGLKRLRGMLKEEEE